MLRRSLSLLPNLGYIWDMIKFYFIKFSLYVFMLTAFLGNGCNEPEPVVPANALWPDYSSPTEEYKLKLSNSQLEFFEESYSTWEPEIKKRLALSGLGSPSKEERATLLRNAFDDALEEVTGYDELAKYRLSDDWPYMLSGYRAVMIALFFDVSSLFGWDFEIPDA